MWDVFTVLDFRLIYLLANLLLKSTIKEQNVKAGDIVIYS